MFPGLEVRKVKIREIKVMYSGSHNEVISLTQIHIPSTSLSCFHLTFVSLLSPSQELLHIQFLQLLLHCSPETVPIYVYSYQSRKVSISPHFHQYQLDFRKLFQNQDVIIKIIARLKFRNNMICQIFKMLNARHLRLSVQCFK